MPRDPKKTKAAKAKKRRQKAEQTYEEEELEEQMEMEDGNEENEEPGLQVWRPGAGGEAEEDVELECDPSTYDCLHNFSLEWPCLSFDVLPDSLGSSRDQWPHSLFMVAGTQAASAKQNSVALMRLTNITKTWKPPRADGDDSDSSEEDSEEEEEEDEQEGGGGGATRRRSGPVLHVRQVALTSGVNRIRCCPHAAHLAACLTDAAQVQVYDLAKQLEQLVAEAPENARAGAAQAPARVAPKQSFSGHADEGYALDWSPTVQGRMLSGDCAGEIHLWEPQGGKWAVGNASYKALSGSGWAANPSVEDLQWSPSEATVFASASADQSVRVWDTRQSAGPALSVRAHTSDVNVISWSRITTCMLASGSDAGDFRIWDLRNLKDENSFVAAFTYHSAPVTSIEWSPHEGSMLAVSSADNQVSFWDLSVERDAEEEAEALANAQGPSAAAPADEDLPAQLMFVHQGQKDVKEVHWHPNIPGMCLSTAGDGFNVFRPNNL